MKNIGVEVQIFENDSKQFVDFIDLQFLIINIALIVIFQMFQSQKSQTQSLYKQSEVSIKGNNYLAITDGNLQTNSKLIVNLPHEKDEYLYEEEGLLPHIILEKWINFVQFHCIESSDIWEGRLSMPVLLFIDIFQKKLGYRFSISQIKCLNQISQDYSLKKEHFGKLNLWTKKSRPKNLYQSLATSASHKTLSTTNRKIAQSQKIGINFHVPSRKSITEKQSFVSQFSRGKTDKSRKLTTFDQMTKTFLKLDFTKDLCTQDSKLQALRSVMQMNSLQKKWQFVVMAGQMNKWFEQIYSNKSEIQNFRPAYKIISNHDNFTIIKSQNGQDQIIPQVVFLKKYNAMKKRVQKQKPKVDVKQTVFANQGAIIQVNNKSQHNRISHRDRELNEALLQIMRMRNTLQHQYKIFAQAAINT